MTIWERADAIRAAIDSHKADETWQAQRARLAVEVEHQTFLRAAYGDLRGWKLSRAPFFIDTIARGKKHRGAVYIDRMALDAPWHILDHLSYWKLNGWPVAIVAQPYDWAGKAIAESDAWAYDCGVVIKAPTDFPSWWYPGRTTLLEITRAPQ